MTDYLEEALDNAEALLEQVKRLERSAPKSGRKLAGETVDVPPADTGGEAWGEELAGRAAVGKLEEMQGANRTGLTGGEARRHEGREEPSAGTVPVPEREQGTLEVPRRVLAPLEAERGAAVLLGQLEMLDRAADRLSQTGVGQGRNARLEPRMEGPALSREPAALPNRDGTSEGRWSAEGGAGQNMLQTAEGMRWAEQADRVFRRDSRRYDGGFYLY